LELERWGVDYEAQRKAQAGFFVVGHSRDGTGRFRILSDGDAKPSQDLVALV
jgi:hypothetical protein